MWWAKQIVVTVLLLTFVLSASSAQQPETKPQKGRVDQYGDPLPPGALARLGAARFRHDGDASLLAYSSDGKKLVGYTASGLIVWDAATGKELRRLPGPEGRYRGKGAKESGDISPDGSVFVILESDPSQGTIALHFWDLSSSKKLLKPAIPTRPGIYRFSPDNKSLVVGDINGKIHLVDLGTNKERTIAERETKGIGRRFKCLAFSPDGKFLAVGLADSSLELWEIATDKMSKRLEHPREGGVEAIAFSADGKMMAWAVRNQIILTDPATGKEIDRFVEGTKDSIRSIPVGMAFTPDGKTLVVGIRDGKVRVWDVASADVRFTFDSGQRDGRSMALSPDGKTVALGTSDVMVRFWNVYTGKELFATFPSHSAEVTRLVFSPDGKTLFSGGDSSVRKSKGFDAGDPQPIRLWDTTKWQQTRVFPGNANTFAISSDGKRLASVVKETVHLIDVATGKDTPMMMIKDPVNKKDPKGFSKRTEINDIVFSLDSRKVFTLESFSLRSWNTATGMELQKVPLRGGGKKGRNQPHFSRDGRTLLMTGGNQGLFLFDLESSRDRSPPRNPNDRNPKETFFGINGISADGRQVGLAPSRLKDCFVNLVDTLTGQELALLKGHELNISTLVWSADGRLVATGDSRKLTRLRENKATPSIRLWDTLTGKELVKFDGFGTDVASLALSLDGTTLAAGLGDGTILIYNVSKVRPKPAVQKFSKEELEERWADLAGDNAAKAYRVAWKLIAAPAQTVALLRERLKPMASVEAKKMQQWIADLGSDQAPVRIAAVKQLQQVIPQAEAAMRQALKKTKSVDATRHLERLLAKLEGSAPDKLRTLRAVMVLERIGSAEARGILEALAKGAPGVRETEEARAALARLARQLH